MLQYQKEMNATTIAPANQLPSHVIEWTINQTHHLRWWLWSWPTLQHSTHWFRLQRNSNIQITERDKSEQHFCVKHRLLHYINIRLLYLIAAIAARAKNILAHLAWIGAEWNWKPTWMMNWIFNDFKVHTRKYFHFQTWSSISYCNHPY